MIGIGSIEHGAGVTSLCLALSNFLCNKRGRKTAYVELNATNQISSLSPGTGNKPFTYKGFTLFPCTTLTSLPEILRMDFQYFVLDMGVLNVYTANEFAKCETQFLVGSLSKWKRKHTLDNVEKLIFNSNLHPEYFTLLTSGSENESNFSLSLPCSLSALPIPYIPNPFQLHSELFSFFGKILGKN